MGNGNKFFESPWVRSLKLFRFFFFFGMVGYLILHVFIVPRFTCVCHETYAGLGQQCVWRQLSYLPLGTRNGTQVFGVSSKCLPLPTKPSSCSCLFIYCLSMVSLCCLCLAVHTTIDLHNPAYFSIDTCPHVHICTLTGRERQRHREIHIKT